MLAEVRPQIIVTICTCRELGQYCNSECCVARQGQCWRKWQRGKVEPSSSGIRSSTPKDCPMSQCKAWGHVYSSVIDRRILGWGVAAPKNAQSIHKPACRIVVTGMDKTPSRSPARASLTRSSTSRNHQSTSCCEGVRHMSSWIVFAHTIHRIRFQVDVHSCQHDRHSVCTPVCHFASTRSRSASS